jgi:exonuclease SbcD
MKIYITADCHLNKSLYKGIFDEEFNVLPFRNGDFMRSFRSIIDTVIQDKADLFIIAGDIYENYEPLNPIRSFFISQLRRLQDACVPTILLIGNHDVCSRHHSLEPIAAIGFKNVQVISSPRLVSFRDKLLMLFPYAMEIENGTYSVKELYNKFFDYCKNKISQTPEYNGKEVIFFGHFGVKGAILNTFEDCSTLEEKEEKVINKRKLFLNKSSKDVSVGDLERLSELGVKYVALGDYHKHQVLPTNKVIAFYTGSIEKSDFSEADDDKGFVVYDTDAVEDGPLGKCRFKTLSNIRRMVEIDGNLKEILEKVDKIDASDGTLVKIKFCGNEEQLREYSDAQKILQQKLKQKLNPIYVVASQEIENKKEKEEAQAIETEILGKENIDDKVLLMIVEEAIAERVEGLEERKVLIDMAEKIFKKTKGD